MLYDKQVLSIILSYFLYALYVLLPLIPAVVVYKIFPDTNVAAEGALSKIKFKAGGAFAAYAVTVALGSFIVFRTLGMIQSCSQQKESESTFWTISGAVQLQDENKKVLTDDTLMTALHINIQPKMLNITGNRFLVKVPADKKDWQTTILHFFIPNFGSAIASLSEISKNSEINSSNFVINLNDPVVITKIPQSNKDYNSNIKRTLSADTTINLTNKEGL